MIRRLSSDFPQVLTVAEAHELGERILSFVSSKVGRIRLLHSARSVTRLTRNQIRSSDEGDTLELTLVSRFGPLGDVRLLLNQVDDATLHSAVQKLESLARQKGSLEEGPQMGFDPGQLDYLPTNLWHDATAAMFGGAQSDIAQVIAEVMQGAGLLGSAFIGAMQRTTVVVNKWGVSAVARETDGELAVSGWNANSKGSGWAGAASRDWSRIDSFAVAKRAVEVTKQAANPTAMEPGRYTAILGPDAVVQLMREMMYAFNARSANSRQSPFSKGKDANRLGEAVMDKRITMASNPAEPDGGFRPFYPHTSETAGLPLRPQAWIDRGVLVSLEYDPYYAASRGVKPFNSSMYSMKMEGSEMMSLEEMIASCERGIYVNRFSNLSLVDRLSGMMTGVTRDGCFFVRNGKIERSLLNFRFVESPFHALNRLIAVGPSSRRAFGYMSGPGSWPLNPMIAPALMVRDFNFAALSEVV